MKARDYIFLLILISGFSIRAVAGNGDSCNYVLHPKPTTISADSVKYMMLNLPDNGTPKQAVFCRFENTLTRTFHIDVRIRVEEPEEK